MPTAANFGFPGGIEQIEIADADDFDAGLTSTFVVTMGRNKIASEGIDIPDPEKVTLELADDRQIRNGLDQELSLRFTNIDTTDFDSLEGAVKDGTEVFVKVTSRAKDGSGNPKWEIVYQDVILNNAAHSAAKPGRDEYGVVIVDGMTTGFETSDIYTLTQN